MDNEQKLAEIYAKCWEDEAFKQRFLTEPVAVLREHEFVIPDDSKVEVHEQSIGTTHLVLPPMPPAQELSEENLDEVSGGGIGAKHRRHMRHPRLVDFRTHWMSTLPGCRCCTP